MQIIIDDNNVVIGFCKGNGRVANGKDVAEIPPDFEPYKYMYVDGKYFLNPDFPPKPAVEPEPEPTSEEILNVLLGVAE